MRIMLVDDDLLIRECIRNYYNWADKGFDICAEASNGEEAWRLVQQAEPDIILTDISMPRCNGVELIKRLSAAEFSGEVIVMSNYSDFDYVKDAMKYGAFDYCLKYKMTAESTLAMLEAARDGIIAKQRPQQNPDAARAYFEAVISGLSVEAPEPPGQYAMVYLRHAPESGQRCSGAADGYVLHISENEDAIISPWGTGSIAERIARLRSQALELAEKYPDAIVSYSTNGFSAGKLRQAAEALWLSADRHFYLGYKVIENEEGFAFKRSIPSQLRSELEESLTQNILCCDRQAFTAALDRAFACFARENIRPKTVHIFCEDILFRVREILDSVRALTFEPFLPEREAVRYISAQQLKEQLHQCIESYFDVAGDIKKADIIRALYYIHANYSDKLTLQQVADYAGISRNHFCTVFRRETGENFVNYLKRLRVEKAQSLLRDGRYRVQDVATMVGIDNSRYFCKVFQEYTGYLPSDYKAGKI